MRNSFSKVLLFGEHTVVNGGRALAMPYGHFQGCWEYTTNNIDRRLAQFADYIDHHDYLFEVIAIDQFFEDLDRGLIFNSNIPIGYGLGSSGTLVAALYHKYAITKGEQTNVKELNRHLADIESFFHGKSSGFDPLVCFLNQPIITQDGDITILDDLPMPEDSYHLFLMNTGLSRSTAPLVERFQEYMSSAANKKRIVDDYMPIVDKAISDLLTRDYSSLYKSIESISGYQYAYLDFLIDSGSKQIWKEGLSSDYFKLKICGAGGGGFLLGITKDINQLTSTYPKREILPLI